jgi:acyl-CoA synthetase (NDP forming)
MQPLSPDTQAELKSILPGFATTTNPVDLTAALLSNSGLFGAILPPIAKDPAADAFLIGVAVAGAGYDVERFASDAQAFAAETGKPLVVASSQDNVAQRFKEQGLVVYPTEGQAVNALSNFLSHTALLEHMGMREPPIRPLPQQPVDVHMLDEADSMALLKQLGVDTVAHAVCHNAQQAVAAFNYMGGQAVVVKGCSRQTSHKSEYGLVALNLRHDTEVAQAFENITRNADKHQLALNGVIVASMVKGQRELMIGAKIDPVFGPVVLVGDGGKYVEAMPDMQVLLPPFNTAQVKAALARLRIAPLLHGVRGDPPMDVDAFSRMAVAVGDCMAAGAHGITQLDINPVIVAAAGQGCVAVDAVVYRGQISTPSQDKT